MIDMLVSRAASLAGQAAEQTRSVAMQVIKGKSPDEMAAIAERAMQTAATNLADAGTRMVGDAISEAKGAVVNRGLAVIGMAGREINSQITRIAGAEVGRHLAPLVQRGSDALGAALKGTSQRFLGMGSGQGEAPVSILSRASPALLSSVGPGASGASAHLLILTSTGGEQFFFGLPTAAFDTLKRVTNYNVAAQERLQRNEAMQAVSKGGETITLAGAIYTAGKAGGRQIDTLRRIGAGMLPLDLATGYGDVLGRWYLAQIEEEQFAILSDGAPRKQTFSLEFRRYGDDYQNA